MRQPEIIVKKVRHSTLEAIKAGKGILAQRQQDIHRQVPCAQDPTKLDGQPFFTAAQSLRSRDEGMPAICRYLVIVRRFTG